MTEMASVERTGDEAIDWAVENALHTDYLKCKIALQK